MNLIRDEGQSWSCGDSDCMRSFGTKRDVAKHVSVVHDGRHKWSRGEQICDSASSSKTNMLTRQEDALEWRRDWICDETGCKCSLPKGQKATKCSSPLLYVLSDVNSESSSSPASSDQGRDYREVKPVGKNSNFDLCVSHVQVPVNRDLKSLS